MSLRRTTLVLLAVLATPSCNLETTNVRDAIALFLEIDKTTISENEAMSVTVRAENVGTETLVLSGPSDCLLYIEVINLSGTRVYNSAQSCAGSQVNEVLAPEAIKEMTFTWSGQHNTGERVIGTFTLRPVALVSSGARAGPGAVVIVQ
ncbi:MAG TPA: hypothetical protein VLE53_13885 [Gemmatimonadaceae bacterium]|nr:hypothetical protein [Gemmatimonadaceae bacterium]